MKIVFEILSDGICGPVGQHRVHVHAKICADERVVYEMIVKRQTVWADISGSLYQIVVIRNKFSHC